MKPRGRKVATATKQRTAAATSPAKRQRSSAKPAVAKVAAAKPAAAKAAAAKPAAGKLAAGKATAAKPAAKPRAKKPAAQRTPAARADFGKPITNFFARQPARLRPVLQELRVLVEESAPDATASIKWGMPFYEIAGTMMCAIGAHKAHVNLILPGPPGTYADPQGLLRGDGKTGRHLRVVSVEEVPHAAVRGWLRTAATRARSHD